MQIEKTNAVEKKEDTRISDWTTLTSPTSTLSQAQNTQTAFSLLSTTSLLPRPVPPLQVPEEQQQQQEIDCKSAYCMNLPPPTEVASNNNDDASFCLQQSSEREGEQAQLQFKLHNVRVAGSPPKTSTTITTTQTANEKNAKNCVQELQGYISPADHSDGNGLHAEDLRRLAVGVATDHAQETAYDSDDSRETLIHCPPGKPALQVELVPQVESVSSSTSPSTVSERRGSLPNVAPSSSSSSSSSSYSSSTTTSDSNSNSDTGSQRNTIHRESEEPIEILDDSSEECIVTPIAVPEELSTPPRVPELPVGLPVSPLESLRLFYYHEALKRYSFSQFNLEQPQLQVNWEQPQLEVNLEQPQLKLNLEQPQLEVQFEQPQLEVNLEQGQLAVNLEQPQLEVNLDQAQLEDNLEQPQLQFQLRQPQLGFQLRQPQLEFQLRQPQLEVQLGQPQLEVQLGQPQLGFQLEQPQLDVQLAQPELDVQLEQPQLDVQFEQPQLEVQLEKPQLGFQLEQPQLDVQLEQPQLDVQLEQPQLEGQLGKPQTEQQKEEAALTYSEAWLKSILQPTPASHTEFSSLISPNVLPEQESSILKEQPIVEHKDIAGLTTPEAETFNFNEETKPEIPVNEEDCTPTTPELLPEPVTPVQSEVPEETQETSHNRIEESLPIRIEQQKNRVLKELNLYFGLVGNSHALQANTDSEECLPSGSKDLTGRATLPNQNTDPATADSVGDYQNCNGVGERRALDAAGMGFDSLLNSIRNFFKYGSSSNINDITVEDQDEDVEILDERKLRNNLKRQTQSHLSPPNAFKYRRVDNTFPRIITPAHLSDRGDYDRVQTDFIYNNAINSDQNFLTFTQQPNLNQSFPHMAAANNGRSKQRRSVFEVPQSTRKVFRGTGTSTEIDLSDDDDDHNDLYAEVVERQARNVGANAAQQTAPIEMSSGLRMHNVPILDGNTVTRSALNQLTQQQQQHQQSVQQLSSVELPQQPLLAAHDGDWVSAYRRHAGMALNTIPLPYLPSSANTELFLRASSSISSQDLSSVGSLHLNGSASGGGGTSFSHAAQPQMLRQERERDEHAQYLSLLKQFVPRVYGSVDDDMRQAKRSFDGQRYSDMLMETKPLASSSLVGLQPQQRMHPQRPLSSIVELDDDDDDDVQQRQRLGSYVIDLGDDDDIIDVNAMSRADIASGGSTYNNTKTSVYSNYRTSQQKRDRQRTLPQLISTVDLLDDDSNDYGKENVNEFKDVVDLSGFDEDEAGTGSDEPIIIENLAGSSRTNLETKTYVRDTSMVTSVNSLEHRLRSCDIMQPDWSDNHSAKWERALQARRQDSQFVQEQVKLMEAERVKRDQEVLARRLNRIKKLDLPFVDLDDLEPQAERETDAIIPFSDEHKCQLRVILSEPNHKVLVSKFNLNITRSDINSLLGLNWLNDEVINFYMSLLTERSEQRPGIPRVYAMNTFFVPKLLQGGHASLRRWTRKVDLFLMDVIPVPVHVGGVHWCMAIIHMKEKSIRYYDSMGKPNPVVLRALEQYLQHESLDKRKVPFDTSGFRVESVADSPRQANGSDCGVFSCMTAEYITRGKPVNFSQANMEYFRQKMILEIVGGQLWH